LLVFSSVAARATLKIARRVDFVAQRVLGGVDATAKGKKRPFAPADSISRRNVARFSRTPNARRVLSSKVGAADN
jgi:hypothetical protein